MDNLSRRRWLNRGLAVAIALVMAIGIFAYIQAQQQVTYHRQQAQKGYEILLQVEILSNSLATAQTEQQRYLLTGNAAYLETYETSRQQTAAAQARLQNLLDGNDAQQQRLMVLTGLIQIKFEQLDRSTQQYQQSPNNVDALQADLTQTSAQLDRQIQTQTNAIEQSVDESLQRQTTRVTASLRRLNLTIAIFATVSLSLLVLIYWTLRRQTRLRTQAETDLTQTNQTLQARKTELEQTNQQLQQEIDQRQQVEDTLRQSEDQFRCLADYAPLGILLLDAQRQCIYVNPRYAAIAGIDAEQALGNGWWAQVQPDDRPCLEQELSPDGAGAACEVCFQRPDGTTCYSTIYVARVTDDQQRLIRYVLTIEDVTERRQISQMKDDFIAIVSHELRTPLSSIRGSLGLLAAGVLADRPETSQQMLDIAVLDTERLTRLVNDILDLNRLNAGQVELNQRWCRASDLVNQAMDTVQAIAQAQAITLTATVDDASVWADPDWLVQTLVNLLGNAIKFSPAQSTVEIGVKRQEQGVLFQVRDRGSGVPAQQLEAIFQPFLQVRTQHRQRRQGTGLGLAICRQIVELHGGRIWAESTVGQGSTFFIQLPLPSN